ncbi:hypothetical protein SS50377_24745 [Spironucleus salmonicida]|uniref:Uncharacterized protein n=1 Tax=Spironucleus salmonicida TaxID=348837 RepID=V6LJ36_9EUKA|nr:hypothetical protein SS50377_24745 [Spironucleus salmonicida]|eukprot:EST44625.1 Hypothetical protein SS50377_15631 [Spironucleus salmonicida]
MKGHKTKQSKSRSITLKQNRVSDKLDQKEEIHDFVTELYDLCFETQHVKDYDEQLQHLNSLLQPLFYPQNSNKYICYGTPIELSLKFQYFEDGHKLSLLAIQSLLISLSIMKSQNIKEFEDLDITFEQLLITQDDLKLFQQVLSIEIINNESNGHKKHMQLIEHLLQKFEPSAIILSKDSFQYYMNLN